MKTAKSAKRPRVFLPVLFISCGICMLLSIFGGYYIAKKNLPKHIYEQGRAAGIAERAKKPFLAKFKRKRNGDIQAPCKLKKKTKAHLLMECRPI